jgi:Chaperone of endosialidase
MISYAATTDGMLLEYSFWPSKEPITVSPPTGEPSFVTLTFIVSKPKGTPDVVLSEIIFTFPHGGSDGAAAGDLTTAPIPASSASMSSSKKKEEWKIDQFGAPGRFRAQSKSGNPVTITDQGLTIMFAKLQVSPVVGTADVKITEKATNGPADPAVRHHTIHVAKFPTQFYFTDFYAAAPLVKHNKKATLKWNGSGEADYYMQWGEAPAVLLTKGQYVWESQPLTDSTSFILRVEAQSGGETVKLHASATVIVENPSLVATDLRIGKTLFKTDDAPSGFTLINDYSTLWMGDGGIWIANRRAGLRGGILLTPNGALKCRRFTVAPDDRVGIGTPDPHSMFHVNSHDGIRLGLEENGGGQLVITNNKDDDSIYLEAVSKDGIGTGGKGAAKKMYLGTPGAPGIADLPQLVLQASNTSVNGRLGVGLAAKLPQNALDVNGGVVIGASLAGVGSAPNNGLKVEGKVILNNDLEVENGTVKVNRLQFLGAQGWTAQQQAGGLTLSKSTGGAAAQFAPDLSCWFQGPVGTELGFYSLGPILLNDRNTNKWIQLSSAQSRDYQWATLIPSAAPSDLRLKSEVQLLPSALEKIRRLRGITFRWNEDALRHFTRDVETTISAGPKATEEENQKVWQAERDKRRAELAPTQVGVLAQEVEAVLPEAVSTDEAGYKTVRYDNLIPLLIEAVKEQSAQIQALSSEVSALAEKLRDNQRTPSEIISTT